MLKRWLLMRAWAPDGGAGVVASGEAPAGGAAGTAAPAGAAAGGGVPAAATPAFADTLPEDIRGEATFKDIKTIDGLARSYHNAVKMIGLDKARLVALPVEGDDAAAAELWAKLGRPDAADKYGFKAPEGVQVDANLQKSFADTAHGLGLTDKQATKLFDWWNGQSSAALKSAEEGKAAATVAAEASLKTEWGAAFDQNLGLAQKAIEHYGSAELRAELDKTGLGNSPKLANLLAKLGKGLLEDGIIKDVGPNAGHGGISSPTEAKQQISALQNDTAFMKVYRDKSQPGHAEAVEKMKGFYEQAFPKSAE